MPTVLAPCRWPDGFVCPRCGKQRAYELVTLRRWQCSDVLIGVVATSFLYARIGARIRNYLANTLPIFLADNVYEGFDITINTCCILGYHASQRPPAATAKTWIYAAYTEPGTLVGNIFSDVVALRHKVAEWLNDPFIGALAIGFLNFIPPAVLPGQDGACIINFEVGDPLEAGPTEFTQVVNGTTYHLQDEVLLQWYLHGTPSFSVNGWYTFGIRSPRSRRFVDLVSRTGYAANLCR